MNDTLHTVDDHGYNATVSSIRLLHDDLMILRVEPDDGIPPFEAGQYTTLGLLPEEPRIGEASPAGAAGGRMIRRAYSISSPMLDDAGELTSHDRFGFLEFYITLVRKPSDEPPSLTPRIFAMQAGHRIFMGHRPKGTYTLQPVQPDDHVIFAATGTGEAPHNTMLSDLLIGGHRGRIASLVCVRKQQDLGYLDTHRCLEQRFSNYRYVPLTTREPENTDANHPGFVGRRYLQDVFSADNLAETLGWLPSAGDTHVFLCGSPAMIGLPEKGPDGNDVFPEPRGMIETLMARGFRPDHPRDPGNIHFETYW
ncbi:MAG: ferredoxin--NADP reductase [Fuerstiella sp.]